MNENELYSPINKEHEPFVEFIEKYPTLLTAPMLIRRNENIFLLKIHENFQISWQKPTEFFSF